MRVLLCIAACLGAASLGSAPALSAGGTTIAGAPVLPFGKTIGGGNDDYELWRLQLQAGTPVQLTFTKSSGGCCMQVYLWPPSVTDATWNDQNPTPFTRRIAPGAPVTATFTPRVSGLWTLQVGTHNDVTIEPYTVRVATENPSCPHVLLLASRGSGDRQSQDQGIGRPELGLQNALAKRIPGLVTWANPYPARGVFDWPWKGIGSIVNGAGAVTKLSGLGVGAYHDSVVDGSKLLAAKLYATIGNCGSSTKIILAGYSQGAQVTADVFQRDLSADERSKVVAMVLFGDPYFNGGDRAVDRGSFSGRRDGLLGKRPWFARGGKTLIRSYCHSHDPICQGFFFRIAFRRELDPGSLTTVQHKNYTKFGEPEEVANEIAQLAAVRG